MRIAPIIRNVIEGAPGTTTTKSPAAGSASFADQLKSGIEEVNKLQNQADSAVEQSTVKGASNIHETMIQLEEANMGFLMLAKVRNKALDAYHEIMRMSF